MSVSRSKTLVWSHLKALFEGSDQDAEAEAEARLAPGFTLNVTYPYQRPLEKADYVPLFRNALTTAFPDLGRRTEILVGSETDGADWVGTYGQYLGRFRLPWGGIAPSHRLASLRFGELWRVDGDRITECYMFLDMMDLLHQAGIFPVGRGLGAVSMVSSPQPQDGLQFADQDPAESQETHDLVVDLIERLMSFDGQNVPAMGMDQVFHKNFMWYGPGGIGTTRGLDGFAEHHQVPFLRAFPNRRGANHIGRIAEGPYAASAGWPSLWATHSGGGWLGLAATHKDITMRVMDIWRREGDKFEENWVMIDLPELFDQMGIDIYHRLGDLGALADDVGDPRLSLAS